MKEREEFTGFVVAQQAVEEHARGRETGIDPYAAALVVKAGQAKFGKAAGELRQFNARLYRYMADAGFYSHETVENIIANNQTYTPFHAVIETRGKKVGGLGAGLTVRDPVKGRKGSICARSTRWRPRSRTCTCSRPWPTGTRRSGPTRSTPRSPRSGSFSGERCPPESPPRAPTPAR